MNAYITNAYASRYADKQELCEEPVEILNEDWIIAPVSEACAFQRKIDKRLTFAELMQQGCLDYDLGCVDAVTTLKRLHDNSLIASPDQLAAIISAGVRALSKEQSS